MPVTHSQIPETQDTELDTIQRLGSRKRRGSFAEKGSVHIIDESDGRAITEWMLDEMPLTDGERYSESSAADDPTIRTGIALGGAGYQNGYYGSRSDESDQLPTPTEHGSSRNMPSGVIGVARAIGKPSLQPGRRPIKAGPASLIHSGPKSKTSNSSLSAASGSKSGTTPRSFTAPLPLSEINGQKRARGLSVSSVSSKSPSLSQSLSQKSARTTSGVSQRKRAGSRSTPSAAVATTAPENSAPPLPRPQLDASGRPLSTLENAIPSWSVPVPKDGNWDEMVLPVVAKQMGLEDYDEAQVNGGQQTPARKGPPPDIYSPAPGTFGYNDPKYRPPRDDIQMEEFGAAASHAQKPKPPHARRQTPPSPAPFARYQHDPRSPPPQVPLHSGTEGPRILLQPPTMVSTEERTRIEPPAEEESSQQSLRDVRAERAGNSETERHSRTPDAGHSGQGNAREGLREPDNTWFGAFNYRTAPLSGFVRNTVAANIPDMVQMEVPADARHPLYLQPATASSHKLPTVAVPPAHHGTVLPSDQDCEFACQRRYTLEESRQYSRGLCYTTEFDCAPAVQATTKRKLERVIPPEELRRGTYSTGITVPGLVRMVPGISYTYRHLNGPHFPGTYSAVKRSAANLETRARVDTATTLMEYARGPEMLETLKEVVQATWGDASKGERPLWECNLVRNSRSGSVNPARQYDGSYSLGITVEECDVGYVGSAKQPNSLAVSRRHNIILTGLGKVAHFLLERSILPHELALWKLLSEVNNAATFGDFRLHSNVQLNHSTGTQDLSESIGSVQGSIHTDPKDWVGSLTVFFCWLRYPKGTQLSFTICNLTMLRLEVTGMQVNIGAFMFAQSGLYFADDDITTLFATDDGRFEMRFFAAIFKGNEPHCAFPPTTKSGHQTSGSIERVGFVCYLSKKAIERAESKMAIFPPSGFFGASSDSLGSQPAVSSKCSALDLLPLQPSREDHITYHARELAYLINDNAHSFGVRLDPSLLENLLHQAKVVDERGEWKRMEPTPLKLHLGDNATKVGEWLQWYVEHCEATNLAVQRSVVKADRQRKRVVLADASEICGAIMMAAAGERTGLVIEDVSEIVRIQWEKSSRSVVYVVKVATTKEEKRLVNEHHHFLLPSHRNYILLVDYLADHTGYIMPAADLSSRTSDRERSESLARESENPGAEPAKRGAAWWAERAVNTDFLHRLVLASLDRDPTDCTRLIGESLTAIYNDSSDDFHKRFSSLQVLGRPGDTAGAVGQSIDKLVITETVLHLSSLSPDADRVCGFDLDFVRLSGVALGAFTYEEQKSFVLSRVTQWLALAALCSLFQWMTSRAGLNALGEAVFDALSTCADSQVSCACSTHPHLSQFLLLGHAVSEYFHNGQVDRSATLPPNVLKPFLTSFKLKSPNRVWIDIRTTIPQHATRPDRVKEHFVSLFRLVLEQVLVYPRMHGFLVSSGAVAPESDDKTRLNQFNHIRNRVLSVGGVLSEFQHIFGSTAIFSFVIEHGWKEIIANPVANLFLDNHRGLIRGSDSLASAMYKDRSLAMTSVRRYLESRLAEQVTAADADTEADPELDTGGAGNRTAPAIGNSAEEVDSGEDVAVTCMTPEASKKEMALERIEHRRSMLLRVLRALETNRDVRSARQHFMHSTVNVESLSWLGKRRFKQLRVVPAAFVKNVDLTPYIAITRACEALSQLLCRLPRQVSHSLLWNFDDNTFLRHVRAHDPWFDLIRGILLGNFKGGRPVKQDPDQTMALREYWRSTALFLELLGAGSGFTDLTSALGLGGILFFFLTCQCSRTQRFARRVGFPTSTRHITDALFSWDVAVDGPFENMALFGQANVTYTFFPGSSTDLASEKHKRHICSRFDEYFGTCLQEEWITFLGDSANCDISDPRWRPRIPFERALDFFNLLRVKYRILGLGVGLLTIQLVNSLAEIGLVEPSSMSTMANFVAISGKLGAAKALSGLGFRTEHDNPSTSALAFHVSYDVIAQMLAGSKLRLTPADHEHRLCKLGRINKRVREAYADPDKLQEWACKFLSPQDKARCRVSVDMVERNIREYNGRLPISVGTAETHNNRLARLTNTR